MLISELFDAICWEISVESGSTDFQLVDGLFILAYPVNAHDRYIPDGAGAGVKHRGRHRAVCAALA